MQVFVAINVYSGNSDHELVSITKKNGQIALAFKQKLLPRSHLPIHSPSLAAITDGSPMAKAFIDAHNAVRALHGTPPLAWDNALADSSLKYASACVKGHATDLPDDVGENLYYTAGSAKFNLDDPALAKTTVDKWYSEEANWDYAASAPKGAGSTGHFTQTVWKSTAKVGCGIAACPNILIGGKTWPDVAYVICRHKKK